MLITSGCSFSTGAMGQELEQKKLTTWSSQLAWHLGRQHVSLALSGGGNNWISHGLVWYIETHRQWFGPDTIVVFNITTFDRLDLLCDPLCPDKNENFPWERHFQTAVANSGGMIGRQRLFKPYYVNAGIDPILTANTLEIIKLSHYLDNVGLPWAFMMMLDFEADPPNQLFADWFEKNQDHNIAFGHTRGMKEWAVANNLTKADGIHPSWQGHDQLTQQYILPWVNKHLIQC
jgi:hypothetical protein